MLISALGMPKATPGIHHQGPYVWALLERL
jgi:hypothetical protein